MDKGETLQFELHIIYGAAHVFVMYLKHQNSITFPRIYVQRDRLALATVHRYYQNIVNELDGYYLSATDALNTSR